jgi:uncharacterized protein
MSHNNSVARITQQRLRNRPIRVLTAVVVLASIIGWLATAWYFSDQIIKPEHGPANPTETVESTTASLHGAPIVSLKRTPTATKPGRWGLVWQGGSAMLGDVVAETSSRVERVLLSGDVPREGTRAVMSATYSPDPKTALGLDFSDVEISTELGPAPAWFIPADPRNLSASTLSTWAITVHGSSADRKQSLKYVPILHRSGLSVLDITYRNDIGAPSSPDGLMHLGESEWRDLQAAVDTAIAMGAQHIVLYGGSMGGAIVLQFLTHSELASRISAVLLEAPMLSVPRMIENLGRVHHMPDLLSSTALHLTNWRLGYDVRQIDVLRFPTRVHPPTLILQDMADRVMPLSVAHEFVSLSAQQGWHIEYAEFPNAGHGETWNTDPDRCEGLISKFLQKNEVGAVGNL